MKYTFIVASLALSAAALPTAAPAKFALQITAQGKSLYLPKGITGGGVEDVAQAESCSVNAETQLVCGGKTIGVTPNGNLDMSQIKPTNDPNAITKGFSIDANNVLHWGGADLQKIPAFKKAITEAPQIYSNGEAKFGFFSGSMTGGATQLYFQLGCPGSDGKYDTPGTHSIMGMGVHNPVITGTNKVVPL